MAARAGRGHRGRTTGVGALASVLLAVTVGVAACAGPGLDATGAATAYRPAVEAAAKATGDALGVQWSPAGEETTQDTSDGCTWYSRSYETPTDLSRRLPDVRSALDSALGGRGFTGAQEEQLPGGWVAATAVDDRDARVAVQAKGRSTLRVSVPVSSGC